MPATRCVLFFPGSKPDLLPKALASGAGLVCIDLEDAVAPDAKDEARRAVMEIVDRRSPARDSVATSGSVGLAVRINHPATEEGERDVAALAEVLARPEGRGVAGGDGGLLSVMIPKSGSAVELEEVHRRLSTGGRAVPIIAVIETAAGLARVEEIAGADGVSALLLGGLDLSVDLGCALDWEALLYARSRCVHAARLGNAAAIDTPFFDVDDPDGLRAEAERSRRLGFSAKAAIHPTQVHVIQQAFAPDRASVEHARRVLAAAEGEGEGARLVDGVMIDRPAVEAARRIVSASVSESAPALETESTPASDSTPEEA